MVSMVMDGNQDDDRENEGRLKFVMDFCPDSNSRTIICV